MGLLWWRKNDQPVSRTKALRELRRARKATKKLSKGRSHNDGYSNPDSSGASSYGGGSW